MSLEYEPKQHNSALAALKQRAAPPTLTEQQANVLYTMPVQTVEQLENVLQHTLALQKTIQASMATLATKESLEPLATSELLQQWLEQTQAFNQETYRSMEHIELEEEIEQTRQEVRDYLGQPERRKLMQLVDAQNLLREKISLASFIAGFKLAQEIAKELEVAPHGKKTS